MHLTRHPLKSAPLTLAAMPWPPRRAVPGRDTCTGRCESAEGCDCCPGPAEACTDIGADTRPAALSMERHRTAGRVALALLIAPAAVAVLAVAAFIAQHLG